VEEEGKSQRALADRAVAVLIGSIGAAGVCSIAGLGFSLLHEADSNAIRARLVGEEESGMGRITFGAGS